MTTASVRAEDEAYTPTTNEVALTYAFHVSTDRPDRYRQFDRWLAAHDAVVRADQVEADAQIVDGIASRAGHRGNQHGADVATFVAGRIRRALVLTPTTKKTEQ